MIKKKTKKRVLTYKEAMIEFDGQWLLLDKREFPPSDDMGYVVAYGDGTPEDRDTLTEINFSEYHGKVLLMKGWVPKDEIFDSGIIDFV
jgi:hypothetical protein